LFYPRNVKWLIFLLFFLSNYRNMIILSWKQIMIFLLFFLSNYRNMIILSWKQIMIFWGINCSLFYPINYFFSVKKKNKLWYFEEVGRTAEQYENKSFALLRCVASNITADWITWAQWTEEGFRQQKQESRWTTDHFTSLEPRDKRETASV